jgi:hypothetical protein
MKAPHLIGVILLLYILFCGCNTPRAAYNKVANNEVLSEKLYEKVLEPRHPCIIKDSVTSSTEKETVDTTSSNDYGPTVTQDTTKENHGDTIVYTIHSLRTVTKTINHYNTKTVNHYTEDLRDKELKTKEIAVLNSKLSDAEALAKKERSGKRKYEWILIGLAALVTGGFLLKKYIQLHNIKIPFTK